ncbi:MAG: DUF4255 domain-containing protein [Bacteroidales bacterium]|jgi:hypothetical protein
MIDKALLFLKDEINNYLKLKTGVNNKIVLSGVVDDTGNVVIDKDTIGLSLINVEEERALKNQVHDNKGTENSNPEIKINLYILFSANFSTYTESLKFISYIILFFQSRSVFTKKNYPQLNDGIEKLLVDLYSLSLDEQNQLWSSLGSKYMPSVLYKVKTLFIKEEIINEISPAITTIKENFSNIKG